MKTLRCISIVLMVSTAVILAGLPVFGGKNNSSSGTTLSGYKTVDICTLDGSTWRYSGVISVWNSGALDTSDFTINDFIEYKTGTKFVKAYNVFVDYKPGVIPAGTSLETALTFPYSIDAPPLAGAIRNNASLTILNHSGSLGIPFGPNPKATYTGGVQPPPCTVDLGCTYTQGYWGNKPDVVWPDPYTRDAPFFLSGQTWQAAMDTPVNVSQGYYQLAHQYIAAALNQANGAYVPAGVLDTLNLADTWLTNNAPSACTAGGSCGTQKDWAATLDMFNNGLYPGGPGHCGE